MVGPDDLRGPFYDSMIIISYIGFKNYFKFFKMLYFSSCFISCCCSS